MKDASSVHVWRNRWLDGENQRLQSKLAQEIELGDEIDRSKTFLKLQRKSGLV